MVSDIVDEPPDRHITKLGRRKAMAFLERTRTALTSTRAAQVAVFNPLAATYSVADTWRIHHLA